MSWGALSFEFKRGVTLVDGWNEDDQRSEGSGKSAIFNSISWLLFGKLPKDANIDDVIKDGETSCEVVLTFDDGETIVRSRKPNDLYFTKSGKPIRGKDLRETQTLLEEYVGLNFDSFCQSVYFAQNYDKKFLSIDQEGKGKILSSIQNLQVFDKARKEVMGLLKIENDKIEKLKNQIQLTDGSQRNIESQITMLQSFIDDKIKKYDQQRKVLTDQLSAASVNLDKSKSELDQVSVAAANIDLKRILADEVGLGIERASVQEKLAKAQYAKSQQATLAAAVAAKQREGNTLANRYNSLLESKKSSESVATSNAYLLVVQRAKKASEYDKQPQYVRLAQKLDELTAYVKNPDKKCPTCGQSCTTLDVSHVDREIAEVRAQMQQIARESAETMEAANQEMVDMVARAQKAAVEADAQAVTIIEQLNAVAKFLDENVVQPETSSEEGDLRSLISQIDEALTSVRSQKTEFAVLRSRVENLQNLVSSQSQQVASLEEAIASTPTPDVSGERAKLSGLEREFATVSEKLQELSNLLDASKVYAAQLDVLKDGFKEIKSYVFVNALNELTYRANQYLSDLFEVQASIKFSSEDEKIETALILDGVPRSLGLLSGGQNRRFNLAVDLALADIVSYRKGSKIDLLIFDEYFKDLSEISMEKSLDLLKARKCPVLMVEHNSVFKNIVDNVFQVLLKDGTSEVVNGA
jgi:DNA repair exonuclease SbcCD ATPase subunit